MLGNSPRPSCVCGLIGHLDPTLLTKDPPWLLLLPSGPANGAAPFPRGPAPQREVDVAYSAPQRQGRPPSAALPKLGSHKTPRSHASQHKQGNLDFLNVPDQGMSG